MAILATSLGASALSAGVSGLANIAQGVGSSIAARKEKERLEDELARIQRNRGLSASQRARLEAAGQSAQIGVERATQAAQAESLAAQAATGGSVSGRDIFLREQATQQARQGAAIASGQQVLDAELAARAEQANRMAQIRAGIGAAESARIGGAAQTGGASAALAGGVIGAVADERKAAEQRQFDLDKLEAELAALDAVELRNAASGSGSPTINYRR